MQIDPTIFKAYDIRGIYPDQLDEEKAYQIARGFATLILSEVTGKPKIAVGSGVAVMLPEFSKEEGRFKSPDKELAAKSVAEGLPDVTLGEPWELLGDEDKVTDIVVDYTNMPAGQGEAHQLDMPNPFDHAKEIVNDIASKMEAAGQLYQS